MAILHNRDVLQTPEMTEAVMGAVHLVAGKELLDEIDEIGVATEGLPEGDVTFLLTDIEGSTPLLELLGRRYAKVLRNVRSVIRAAVLEVGGRQVEARADEYVAVFADADSAVVAAVEMQKAMGAFDWPAGSSVNIRVGLHSGEITLTEAGYIGLTVHTAARNHVCGPRRPGLSSNETRKRLTPTTEIDLLDLGMFKLRGLSQRHKLLQVSAEGLGKKFAPPAV